MIDQVTLKEILSYDPNSGNFYWRVAPGKRVRAGTIAGCPDGRGYIVIRVRGRNYRAHRLAFLYMDGLLPLNQVDHVNGARADNRWVNLRHATCGENQQNRAKAKNNTSDLLGVSFHKGNGKWQARIKVNGREVFLGYFETQESAHRRYLDAKSCLHTFNPNCRPRQPRHNSSVTLGT